MFPLRVVCHYVAARGVELGTHGVPQKTKVFPFAYTQ